MNWNSSLIKSYNEICIKRGETVPPEQIRQAHHVLKKMANKIKFNEFQFLKWKPIALEKKDGGKRIIIKPPLYDRVVLRSISEYLSKFLNPTFKKVKNISFAYQR